MCILILLLIISSLPILNDMNSPQAEENGIEVVDGSASIDQDETQQDDSGGFEQKRDGEKAGTGKLVDFGA